MLDHEADNIRQENANETPQPQMTAEIATGQQDTADDAETRTPQTMESLIARLKELAGNEDAEISTDEISRIKQHFYHLRNESMRDAQTQQDGAEQPATPAPQPDPIEEEFKSLMAQIKEKKAAQRARIEAQQLANLERKKAIIAQINEMAADTDNVNRHYPAVKDLQTAFKEIGEVPQTDFTENWKSYHRKFLFFP